MCDLQQLNMISFYKGLIHHITQPANYIIVSGM